MFGIKLLKGQIVEVNDPEFSGEVVASVTHPVEETLEIFFRNDPRELPASGSGMEIGIKKYTVISAKWTNRKKLKAKFRLLPLQQED